MGKIKRVDIEFSNASGVFYSGQEVTGKVVAELTDSMKVRCVKLKFFGEVAVSFTDNAKRQKSHSEKEKYFEQVDILFGHGKAAQVIWLCFVPKGVLEAAARCSDIGMGDDNVCPPQF